MLLQDTFSCSYTTPYHRIANAANAFDLDFHDIPVMQKERGSAFEPHSRWRPCRDDIAWLQGHEGTEESDRRGHRKDHIGGLSCCTTCSFTLVVSVSVWGLGMLDART